MIRAALETVIGPDRVFNLDPGTREVIAFDTGADPPKRRHVVVPRPHEQRVCWDDGTSGETAVANWAAAFLSQISASDGVAVHVNSHGVDYISFKYLIMDSNELEIAFGKLSRCML